MKAAPAESKIIEPHLEDYIPHWLVTTPDMTSEQILQVAIDHFGDRPTQGIA